MQLHAAVPQVLLPVLPQLSSELHSDDVSRRMDAVSVLGRLFSGRAAGRRLAAEYADVVESLLGRFTDQAVRPGTRGACGMLRDQGACGALEGPGGHVGWTAEGGGGGEACAQPAVFGGAPR